MGNYLVDSEEVGQNAIRLRFGEHSKGGRFFSRAEVHDHWKSNSPFCDAFSQSLAIVPMEAYFWETPELSAETFDSTFECVLSPAVSLIKQTADPRPFAAQLGVTALTSSVVSFGNLGGDADLIVPRATEVDTNYAHLAGFLRTATAAQTRAMWSLVAQTADHWLARGQSCWISTSGLGVAWLHIRIDARPKYYSHAPYKGINHG